MKIERVEIKVQYNTHALLKSSSLEDSPFSLT